MGGIPATGAAAARPRARTLRPPWRQRRSHRMSDARTCSARCDRDARGAAHAWGARRRTAALRGGSCNRVARAARVRARLTAIATRRERPTPGPPGANRPTAVKEAAVASHEQRAYELGSLRSRHAGSGQPSGRTAQNRQPLWQQWWSRRASGTCTCSARCNRERAGSSPHLGQPAHTNHRP